MKLHKAMIPTFSKIDFYKKTLQDIFTEFGEIKMIHGDPINYQYVYFNDLISQVDIRRETLIETIHDQSRILIESLKSRYVECSEKHKDESMIDEMNKIVFDCKGGLERIEATFSSLELNDDILNELTCQTLCDERNHILLILYF